MTEKLRVLMVDDEPSLLFMLGIILRSAGHFTVSARDGAEALEKFKDGCWDLVITDRAMPKMGGEELALEIRMIAPLVPIILITGYLKSDTRTELFDEILEKPFSKANLLSAIEHALAGVLHH